MGPDDVTGTAFGVRHAASVAHGPGTAGFGEVGGKGARLLAGPPASSGPETLDAHLLRLGTVSAARRGRVLLEAVEESGLGGRGGAGFPSAAKMHAVVSSAGRPLVVVNASESEPASFKDRTLLRFRPHLVLDGAALAAGMIGADEVVVQLHRDDNAGQIALSCALAERAAVALDGVPMRLSLGPGRFVAGESSAVVAFLEGLPARPRPGRRAAFSGVDGRPTLVHNAETVAHIALIARRGAKWFRQSGSPRSPGSVLVTVHGEVQRPGTVFEVWGRATIGELVAAASAPPAPGWFPRSGAVLIGGYGGTWVGGDEAHALPPWREELAPVGASLGCGLLGVLGPGSCGLAETARILSYLAGESAGQCGPCVLGLPELADLALAIAAGRLSRKGRRRLPVLVDAIAGRGGCSHPDGSVSLLQSALTVFDEDLQRHLRGRPCEGAFRPGSLPVPAREERWR